MIISLAYLECDGDGVRSGMCRVAIYRLLQNSAFEPDDIIHMVDAYERALVALRLKDRNDPITETVAKLIIEAAQTGQKDPAEICALALKRMRD